MDIRDLLRKDHVEALRLAKHMSETNDAASAKNAYKTLRTELTAHSRAEEAVVYAALNKLGVKDATEMGHEGEVEHGLCDELLTQMARGGADKDTWKAKATVVCELLEHHVEEEHTEMFPLLAKHFSAEERVAMGAKFEARKRTLLAA